jgi:2-iminobutanoate/2-iminopropanoate deaminase
MSSNTVERFNSGRVVPASLPFPEGTAAGGFVFLSGQLGNVPGTLTLVEGGIEAEARQTLENIASILRGQGLGLDKLVRCTVMLADMAEWPAFNAVYSAFFAGVPMPARSAFGCSGLALGARVEIECTAAR